MFVNIQAENPRYDENCSNYIFSNLVPKSPNPEIGFKGEKKNIVLSRTLLKTNVSVRIPGPRLRALLAHKTPDLNRRVYARDLDREEPLTFLASGRLMWWAGIHSAL